MPWRDTFSIAGLVAALYLVLGQRAFHGLDVQDFIAWLQLGKATHHIHYLYMPAVSGLYRWLAPHGWLPHDCLLLASQLGGVAGVLGVHRAGAVLALSRARCALAALGTAVTPAVLFFATVAEIHAVFFGVFGLVAWLLARAMTRGSVAAWLWIGCSTALAAAVHATGHLLVLLVLLVAFGLRGRVAVRWTVIAALGVAHALATVGLDRVARPREVSVTEAGVLGYLWRCAQTCDFGARWWPVLRDEWVTAFLPGSVLLVLAAFVARTRRFAAALLVALAIYYAFALALLPEQLERGAYFLPLAWPVAILLLLWLRPWLAALLLSAGGVLGVVQVLRSDQPFENPVLLRGVAQLAEHGPLVVLCGGDDEWQPLLRDQATVSSTPLFWFGQMLHLGYDAFTARFDQLVAAQLDAGMAVVVTGNAHQLLTSVPEPTLARFVREWLPARYLLTPVNSAVPGFVAYRLTRR